MAHRKLQQEIDKVFKKINEGLDIFNTYHERHENAPNPSVKEKLENDLKREVKKLQKLREQIKVWQAQSEVKDKEKLLEYRRSVEVAMEKYKIVEKGSKVKAYSNMSLKAAGELDPEEQEKMETIQFIQDSIDELEHQFETVDVEIEKLVAKKSKKSANNAQKEELKEIQQKYRWHQQQLELTLRLLENSELEVSDIQEIKEELEYFLQNNRNSDFIENEYIYETLDLESNEVLQHEVVTSFNGIVDHDHEREKSPPVQVKKSQSPEKKAVIQNGHNNNNNTQPTDTTHTPNNNFPSATSHTQTHTHTHTYTPTLTPTTTHISTSGQKKTLNLGLNTPLPTTSTLKPASPPKQEVQWSSVIAGFREEGGKEKAKVAVEEELRIPNVVESVVAAADVSPSSSMATTTSQQREGSVPVDDTLFKEDYSVMYLPPGIQDIICSFYSSRKASEKLVQSSSMLLQVPRDHLITEVTPVQSSSVDYNRSMNLWSIVRGRLALQGESVMSSVEISTLFYVFYYAMTPYESSLAEGELVKRGWSTDKAKVLWYLPVGGSADSGARNYKRFDARAWSLGDVFNYKLDYSEMS